MCVHSSHFAGGKIWKLVPAIGEIPGMKGCYVVKGHIRWGILNGPATGAAMAELVIDGHSTIVDL
ncbi:putative oxidoreductase TDA3, partial [Tanacetum coccineum]